MSGKNNCCMAHILNQLKGVLDQAYYLNIITVEWWNSNTKIVGVPLIYVSLKKVSSPK